MGDDSLPKGPSLFVPGERANVVGGVRMGRCDGGGLLRPATGLLQAEAAVEGEFLTVDDGCAGRRGRSKHPKQAMWRGKRGEGEYREGGGGELAGEGRES